MVTKHTLNLLSMKNTLQKTLEKEVQNSFFLTFENDTKNPKKRQSGK